ncbi:MAG: sodium-dependent transporter [Candidatus Aminicenantia bacterium]
MEEKRGTWGSKLKFVLAAAGSAVGLGNVWRFPTYTGLHGGAAFVLFYIIAVCLVGIPLIIAELTIGRHTQKNPVGAFRAIVPKSGWVIIGFFGILTGIFILSYYSVIAGWVIGYIFLTASGTFKGEEELISRIFQNVTSNPYISIILLFITIAITTYIISKGVQKGIESWTRVLMPILFLILVGLAIRSLTLPGAAKGINFYLSPDFSKIDSSVIFSAIGQAFFSLSLGMGAMLTYGSYLSKKEDIFSSSIWVAFVDTGVAFTAGLVIFPALFTIPGLSPAEGPSLVFKVLPYIFARIPGGLIFGTAFFVLLTIAAITSTISLLEVPTAYFVDEKKWARWKGAIFIGLLSFLLGIPSALSFGAVKPLSFLPIVKIDFLSLMDLIWGNLILIIGSLLIAIFLGWKWGIRNAVIEMESSGKTFPLKNLWGILIKYVVPVAILLILINTVYTYIVK